MIYLGMPNLPSEISTKIRIDRRGLVKLLLMSIALEEISLSHIMNAEGEIMQLYMKSLKCSPQINCNELVKLNRNLCDTLRLLVEKERILKDKLIHIIQYNEDQDYSECEHQNLDCHN